MRRYVKQCYNLLVPVEGIEPPLLAEHDFESCASASSATRARCCHIESAHQARIHRRGEPPRQEELRTARIRRSRAVCAAIAAGLASTPMIGTLGLPRSCAEPDGPWIRPQPSNTACCAARAAARPRGRARHIRGQPATLRGRLVFPTRARLSALPALPAAAHPLLYRHTAVAAAGDRGAAAAHRPSLVGAGLAMILIAVLVQRGARHLSRRRRVAFLGWPDRLHRAARPTSTAAARCSTSCNAIHVVRCDEAAWRFLGISLAGYNVLISLLHGGDRGLRPAGAAQAIGLTGRYAGTRDKRLLGHPVPPMRVARGASIN